MYLLHFLLHKAKQSEQYPEICSVSVLFEDTIGLYGGVTARLVVLSIIFVVILSSVECVFVLVDMRLLFLCSIWQGVECSWCIFHRE